jgi:chemotaxis signal transduction protein
LLPWSCMNMMNEMSARKAAKWGMIEMISAVLCKVGESEVVVNAVDIESIEPITKINKMLKVPEYIAGVMDSRGILLTMLDLNYLLYDVPMVPDDLCRAILVNRQGKKYGLMVSEANDFIQLEDEQVGASDMGIPYLKEIVTVSPSTEADSKASVTAKRQLLLDLDALMAYLAQLIPE